MEKEKDEVVKEKKKLSTKQKEMIVAIVVVIVSIIVGVFLGKLLYDKVYGPI